MVRYGEKMVRDGGVKRAKDGRAGDFDLVSLNSLLTKTFLSPGLSCSQNSPDNSSLRTKTLLKLELSCNEKFPENVNIQPQLDLYQGAVARVLVDYSIQFHRIEPVVREQECQESIY